MVLNNSTKDNGRGMRWSPEGADVTLATEDAYMPPSLISLQPFLLSLLFLLDNARALEPKSYSYFVHLAIATSYRSLKLS